MPAPGEPCFQRARQLAADGEHTVVDVQRKRRRELNVVVSASPLAGPGQGRSSGVSVAEDLDAEAVNEDIRKAPRGRTTLAASIGKGVRTQNRYTRSL